MYLVNIFVCLLDHVLLTLLDKLFSFISIGEVFNFKNAVYFFLHIILNIKFIIWYSLLGIFEKYAVTISCIYISKQNSINSSKLLLRYEKL